MRQALALPHVARGAAAATTGRHPGTIRLQVCMPGPPASRLRWPCRRAGHSSETTQSDRAGLCESVHRALGSDEDRSARSRAPALALESLRRRARESAAPLVHRTRSIRWSPIPKASKLLHRRVGLLALRVAGSQTVETKRDVFKRAHGHAG